MREAKLGLMGPTACKQIQTRIFGSMIVGVFQITFHVKIYANDIFLFLKKYF